MSFSSVKKEGEPTVAATLAPEHCSDEADIHHQVSPRYGSVHLDALNAETRQVLAKFDRNRDGQVDADELEDVIEALVREQFKSRLFLLGIVMIVFALLILITCGFGLTWAVVKAHKDTKLRGSVLVNYETGKPVEISNSDFTLNKEALVSRYGAGLAVATAPLVRWRTLNANMTTYMLNSLVRISINATSGAKVGFKVTGFALRQGTPPELLVNTPAGTLLVKGEVLNDVDAASNLLDPSELKGAGVLGIFYEK